MGNRLILLVDDDQDILNVLRANLTLHEYEVETAMSCAETEERLSKGIPDLMILDLMLPDCDGIDLCRKIKKNYPNVPIIMLTARDRVSDKVIGLESGADDYVVKPFETLELIARIKACLRRYKAEQKDILKVGDIVVDYQRRMVKVGTREIELTPKEFELLCMFMENRGKVLSRDFIRKSLWRGSRLYSWSRVIDVHIQHLRHKIEKDPSSPEYILTVAGVGYKFAE
jgi:DNA-binding response OmpR family regulator